MRTLQPATADAIANDLKSAPGGSAGVYCVERNWECVPFKVGERILVMEFGTPYFLTQNLPYNEILLRTKSGGYFVPKLQYRNISVSYLTDDQMLGELCALPTAELTQNQAALIAGMRDALIRYYRSYPNANQYFFQYQASTKDLLSQVCVNIPPDLKDKYVLETYPDLAEPYGGFSLTSKSL